MQAAEALRQRGVLQGLGRFDRRTKFLWYVERCPLHEMALSGRVWERMDAQVSTSKAGATRLMTVLKFQNPVWVYRLSHERILWDNVVLSDSD